MANGNRRNSRREPSTYEIMREFKDEMVQVTKDYQVAITSIETAVSELNSYKKKWWVAYRKWLIGLVVFLIFLTVYLLYKTGDDCSLNVNGPYDVGFEVSQKDCSND